MAGKLISLLMVLVLVFGCASVYADDTQEQPERTVAAYEFMLQEEESLYYENLIFPSDVVISGDHSQIVFVNCEFNGNVILTAQTATRVLLLGCEVNGQCIYDNGVQDADLIEYSFPKILTDTPVSAVCEGGIATLGLLGDFEAEFNGETYSLADSEFFSGPVNEDGIPSLVPYEGQQADFLIIVQVMTGGEPSLTLLCEADEATAE